jgi:hypothetical protein
MVSAVWTTSTIAITYNEPVSCNSSTHLAFTYYYNGTAGVVPTSCANATDVLTLGGTFVAPVAGAYIGYTVPVTPTNGVYGTSAALYAAAQTLAVPVGITGTVTVTAVPAAVTAGTAATWTLTASPAVSGTYPLSVSGQAPSPSHAIATYPTTVTFNSGTAYVPVTLVDAASQTLTFTVTGATGAASTAVTPAAAAASSGYALNSGYTTTACTSTTLASSNTIWTGPTYSTSGTTATQSTPASTTPAGCYVTVVQGVDAYGNPVASGSVPVTFSPAAGTTNAAYIWTGTTSGTELGATPVSVTLGASGQAQIETVVHTNPATGAGDTFVAGPAGSPGITTTITDGGV